MKKIIFLLLIILLVFSFKTKQKTKEVLELENDYYHVSLFAVGDNLIHSTIYKAAKLDGKYDFKPMFLEVKPLISQFDLKFVNQETILGGEELGLSTYPTFNSPYEVGDALVDLGFNLISIANNHTLDRGERAIINAINYWDSKGVIYSGALKNKNASHLKLFNINGIKFAFVAYTYGTNGIGFPDGKDYLANVYSNEKAKFDIKKIINLVDVVIVSMHWGNEYEDYPNATQVNQAKFLAELGVDIIIGHHPHVIQPVDVIENDNKNTFVFYSLGNFLLNQKGIDRLVGMAVSLDIYKSKSSNMVNIKNLKANLLYRYKENNNFCIKLFQDLNDEYLSNYLEYFKKKKSLIQKYYQGIEVN